MVFSDVLIIIVNVQPLVIIVNVQFSLIQYYLVYRSIIIFMKSTVDSRDNN
jgi:hypothetical protein